MKNLLPALVLALSGAVVAIAAPAPELPDMSELPQVEAFGDIGVFNGGASADEARCKKEPQKASD